MKNPEEWKKALDRSTKMLAKSIDEGAWSESDLRKGKLRGTAATVSGALVIVIGAEESVNDVADTLGIRRLGDPTIQKATL
jgi:hypothetical protein